MRKTVHSKLICSYIFIGIVGFLFATAGGSHFVETYLEEEVGARLYDSAVRFASDAVTIQQVADNDSKGLEKIMDILASGEEAGILILDKNFHVIVQSSNLEYNVSSAKSTADSEVQTSETDKIPENGTSSEKFSAANTISIPYSDLDFWLNTQYQISNFYGYFSSPHLNVMISVENSGVTEGYVTYHYDMQQLYQKRSGLLGILQMVFFAVYALCGLLLLCYQKWIHTPNATDHQGGFRICQRRSELSHSSEIRGRNGLSCQNPELHGRQDQPERRIPAHLYCQCFPRFPLSSDFPSKDMWRQFWMAPSPRNCRTNI